MNENAISQIIVDAAMQVHREMGPGLFESVYEAVMAFELADRGLRVERQVVVPVRYKGLQIEEGFRADLVVNGLVMVELKSVEQLANVHKKQLLTYLKLSGCKLGLLLNFGGALLRDGIVRIVNGLPDA